MEKIQFNSLIRVVNFFSDADYLGRGHEGSCYRKGDSVYKLYNPLYCNLLDNDIARKRLLKFRNTIVENVYFIRKLIYFDNDLIGSVADYARGSNCIENKLYRKRIDKLVEALAILKKTIYELSQLGIYINDECLANTIYDGKVFKLIDVGSYLCSSEILESEMDEDKDDVLIIYRKNMCKIMKYLFGAITDKKEEYDNFIFSFLWYIDSPYKTYLIDSEMLMNPEQTIMGIRDTIQETIGREIVSFSNCRSDLMRIRKKR